MPLERCPLCSAIPEQCYRETVTSFVADFEVDYGDEGRGTDTVPPQVGQLETVLGGPGISSIMRCATCHRLYHHDVATEHLGARSYCTWSYTRSDADTLFRTQCCVLRRLPDRTIESLQPHDLFRHHTIVRFREAPTWCSLDDTNRVVELSSETLPRLTASDPPTGLDDAARARAFAALVSEVEDPDVSVVDSFASIRWREPLTDEDRRNRSRLRARPARSRHRRQSAPRTTSSYACGSSRSGA